ncbi:trypsin-like peptidase domain-containing protein [Pseudonocardia sp. EC080625-04]|uniref:trypsin-like peptidase domain-containing protein n=1 Tax=Pseudonocardia sp. EC080625-04 TaxID=1096868 RepID=UPI000A594E24|nr:trypsin-like peptidase domain-containing protein [Pseudonocardia sp. EC080625-04]
MAQDNPPDEGTGADVPTTGGPGSAGAAYPERSGAGERETGRVDSGTAAAGTPADLRAGDDGSAADRGPDTADTVGTGSGDTGTGDAGSDGVVTASTPASNPADRPDPDAGPDADAVSTQDPPTDRWEVPPASPWSRSGGTDPGPRRTGRERRTRRRRGTGAPDPARPVTEQLPPWAYGAQPVPGDDPSGGPGVDAPPPRRPRRTVAMIVGGLVLALVAGAIGGAIGTDIARSSASGGGVLDSPVPEAESDLPVTPVESVAARVLPSVVQLRVEGGAGNTGSRGEGSGMVISEDGLILTNNHVVEPAGSGGTLRAVLQDGRVAVGSIVGQDPQSDVALVRVQLAGLTPVELANSDGVRVGQQVTAFGSPLGLGGSVTTGIVSALDRAVSVGGEAGGASTVLNAIQTDAAINPGNSGGPLVDMEGRVVGINSAIATAGPGGGSIGVGFSIPVNQARRIADQLRTGGPATHAVLGVEVADDPQLGGAIVRTVTPGGAAEQAGLRPNDVVQRLGDQRISTGTDLQAAVRSQPPGSVVELQLQDRTVQVTLGEQ